MMKNPISNLADLDNSPLFLRMRDVPTTINAKLPYAINWAKAVEIKMVTNTCTLNVTSTNGTKKQIFISLLTFTIYLKLSIMAIYLSYIDSILN